MQVSCPRHKTPTTTGRELLLLQFCLEQVVDKATMRVTETSVKDNLRHARYENQKFADFDFAPSDNAWPCACGRGDFC